MANDLLESAKKSAAKWKAKQKAAKGLSKEAVDALQKHMQTKNVKRLMTTGGAYKKRAPMALIKIRDTKSSGPKLGPAGSGGYKFYKGGGRAYGKNS